MCDLYVPRKINEKLIEFPYNKKWHKKNGGALLKKQNKNSTIQRGG
jgi:hypothetical protein